MILYISTYIILQPILSIVIFSVVIGEKLAKDWAVNLAPLIVDNNIIIININLFQDELLQHISSTEEKKSYQVKKDPSLHCVELVYGLPGRR